MDGDTDLNLIEALQSEARWDSSGCFTLDLERSTHWLSSGLFREADFFWLKWVQFGVAAQATQIEWKASSAQTHLCMSSPNFRPEQLPNPLELLQKPLTQSHHFALALHALRAQNQRCAVLCSGPEQAWLLQMDGVHLRLEQAPPSPQPQLQVSILQSRRSLESPRLLGERCRYCHVPVLWNNKRLDGQLPSQNLPSQGYPWLVDRLYLHDRLPAPLRLPPFTQMPAAVYDTGVGYQDFYSRASTLLHQWRTFWKRRSGLYEAIAPPQCRVQQSRSLLPLIRLPEGSEVLYRGGYRAGNAFRGLSLHQVLCVQEFPYPRLDRHCIAGRGRWRIPSLPPAAAPNWLYLCQDGVLLEPVPFESNFRGSQLIWADDEISTDLSGLKPVLQDERLARLLAWVQEDAQKLHSDLRKTLYWSEKYSVPRNWPSQVARLHGLEIRFSPSGP